MGSPLARESMVSRIERHQIKVIMLILHPGIVGAELRNKQQSKILSLASMHV